MTTEKAINNVLTSWVLGEITDKQKDKAIEKLRKQHQPIIDKEVLILAVLAFLALC